MQDETSALLNARNRNQGNYKKVLCVCSAGMLRSATAAWLLGQEPYNYNTRSCGVREYAMIPFTAVLLHWADEIICMGGGEHSSVIESHELFKANPKPIRCLNIPDNFQYREPELVNLIREAI